MQIHSIPCQAFLVWPAIKHHSQMTQGRPWREVESKSGETPAGVWVRSQLVPAQLHSPEERQQCPPALGRASTPSSHQANIPTPPAASSAASSGNAKTRGKFPQSRVTFAVGFCEDFCCVLTSPLSLHTSEHYALSSHPSFSKIQVRRTKCKSLEPLEEQF